MNRKWKSLSVLLLLSVVLSGLWTPLWAQGGGFAYVANFGSSNDVSAYTIDATTGALAPVPGGPFAAGKAPRSVTVDPAGQFIYVANHNSNDVSAFVIDAMSGALTPVADSPFSAGPNPTSVTVDPTGQFVYVANCGSPLCSLPGPGNVSAYTIDAMSGVLTPVSGTPFQAGTNPAGVTVDPTGQFAYVANFLSNDVSAYTIDATSGALTPVPGSPFAAGAGAAAVVVSPSGKFVYVPNYNSSNVSAYTIDAMSGALTPVPGSPFPAERLPLSVTVDPTSQFVYVSNSNSNNVSAYTIDAASGALTQIDSPFHTGGTPVGITVDPTGQFVYVANCESPACLTSSSGDVSAYTIDATGALTPVGSPFPAGAGSVWVTTTMGLHPSPTRPAQ